jgi:tetratricopeptide (TPR) repeat protein
LSQYSRIILVATILIVAFLAIGLHLAAPPEVPPAPELLLERAEAAHRSLAVEARPDPLRLHRIRGDYRAAAAIAEPRLRAAAYYGDGQISLLLGDTPAALAAWEGLLVIEPDDFGRLRVMKSLADLAEGSGDTDAARKWYARIVAEFGDSELPPASAMLVGAARRRIE